MPHVGSLFSGYTVRENGLWLSDTTVGNATSSRHGLLPKLPNDATKFLDGTGAWVAAGGSVTRRIPIISAHTVLDTTGDCVYETYDTLATNDIFKHGIFRFGADNTAQPTVKAGFFSDFLIPHDYASGGSIDAYWTSTKTSGDWVGEFAYRSIGGDDAESLDQTTSVEAATATDTAPGATDRLMKMTISLTAANLAADDLVEYAFRRDGTSGSDTIAGSVILHGLYFVYST